MIKSDKIILGIMVIILLIFVMVMFFIELKKFYSLRENVIGFCEYKYGKGYILFEETEKVGLMLNQDGFFRCYNPNDTEFTIKMFSIYSNEFNYYRSLKNEMDS